MWKRGRGREVDGFSGEDEVSEFERIISIPNCYKKRQQASREQPTPFTILVPTRVTCPLTLSLLGLLNTSVLPGSIGASSA